MKDAGAHVKPPGSPGMQTGGRRGMLLAWHDAMTEAFGPLGWWPAETPFEVAVGAVLTQNTAWLNVEKAMTRLKELDALRPVVMRSLPRPILEEALRPSGFFRQKAVKLHALLDFLEEKGGLTGDGTDEGLACLAGEKPDALRRAVLGIRGIGPETADCIMLYALNKPFFVVDAYTRRILARHRLAPETVAYGDLQDFFMNALPSDRPGSVRLYNEYHAQLVEVGKNFCRKTNPLCGACPLGVFLKPGETCLEPGNDFFMSDGGVFFEHEPV